MRESLSQIIKYSKEVNLSADETGLLILLYEEDVAGLSLNGNGWFDSDKETNAFFNEGDITKKPLYDHFVKLFPQYKRLSEEEQEENRKELIGEFSQLFNENPELFERGNIDGLTAEQKD